MRVAVLDSHEQPSALERFAGGRLAFNMLTSEESPVRDDVRTAYRLIYDYKSGQIEPGSAISEDQYRLIRLLAADLEVEIEGVDVGTLVRRVARADTRWNHETMAALVDFHDLRAAGRAAEAEAIRTRFLGSCPSTWYRAIVADV